MCLKKQRFWVLVFATALFFPVIISAATITVDTNADNTDGGDGDCTLREALNNANDYNDSDTTNGDCATGSDHDTIVFSSLSGEIHLGAQLGVSPPLSGTVTSVTIDGTGQASPPFSTLSISGLDLSTGNQTRLMIVFDDATLHLKALTIKDGFVPIEDPFGLAGGGAIVNNGTMTITDSTFFANEGALVDDGGAIWNRGTLTIINSTFDRNTAGRGGAIFNEGALAVTNSTFAGNSALSGLGGGIVNFPTGSLTITNSTLGNGGFLANNIANYGTLRLRNSILSLGPSGPDCANFLDGTIVENTNNLIEDGTCNSDFSGDPMFNGLGPHGGLTWTVELLASSPAIDKGDADICANAPVNNLDQRGFARPVDGDAVPGAVCDIGAYEFGAQPPDESIEAAIDIQFCGDPNAFNCGKKGVLPVTIFGSNDLDVDEIDINTVELCLAADPNECVSAIDMQFPVDKGDPDTDPGTDQCTVQGKVKRANPDGIDDVDVLFAAAQVAELIGCPLPKRTTSPTLLLKGELTDGTAFQSEPANDVGIDRLLIQK